MLGDGFRILAKVGRRWVGVAFDYFGVGVVYGQFRAYVRPCGLGVFAVNCTAECLAVCHRDELGYGGFHYAAIPCDQIKFTSEESSLIVHLFCIMVRYFLLFQQKIPDRDQRED